MNLNCVAPKIANNPIDVSKLIISGGALTSAALKRVTVTVINDNDSGAYSASDETKADESFTTNAQIYIGGLVLQLMYRNRDLFIYYLDISALGVELTLF